MVGTRNRLFLFLDLMFLVGDGLLELLVVEEVDDGVKFFFFHSNITFLILIS